MSVSYHGTAVGWMSLFGRPHISQHSGVPEMLETQHGCCMCDIKPTPHLFSANLFDSWLRSAQYLVCGVPAVLLFLFKDRQLIRNNIADGKDHFISIHVMYSYHRYHDNMDCFIHSFIVFF